MKIWKFFLAVICTCLISQNSYAASGAEIEVRVDHQLENFKMNEWGAEDILKQAKGVLVFPGTWKAGIGLGGQYGEGALRIEGKTVDYYSVGGISFGFQLGVQKQAIVLAFMDEKALKDFQYSDGWEIGLDASVALITVGLDGSLDSVTYNEPILAFVVDQKGLMYNLNIEGYKISRIKK